MSDRQFAPAPRRPIHECMFGLTRPFAAVAFLAARPSLWKYAIFPWLITIALFVGAVFVGVTEGHGLFSRLAAETTDVATVLVWVGFALFVALLVVAVGMLVMFLSALISAPFIDMLCEKIEHELIGPTEAPLTLKGVAKDARISVAHTIIGAAEFGVGMFGVALVNAIPVVGVAAAVPIGIIVTAWAVGRGFTDMPMSRRRFTVHEKRQLSWGESPMMLGLGLGVQMMMLVPVLNVLMLPIGSVAGTMAFARLHADRRIPFPDRRISPASSAAPPAPVPVAATTHI